jgi:uncharacterized protein YutE (UPF0331/DUF86 family)
MKAKLQKFLNNRNIQPHHSTEKEIENYKKLTTPDLKDCMIEKLSVDRRFATAYQAALNLSKMVIAINGYRVTTKKGHHILTFEVTGIILGAKFKRYLDYFDICRRKRNIIDYDYTKVASSSELRELLETVNEFKSIVFDLFETE